jgi:hypothetical protein
MTLDFSAGGDFLVAGAGDADVITGVLPDADAVVLTYADTITDVVTEAADADADREVAAIRSAVSSKIVSAAKIMKPSFRFFSSCLPPLIALHVTHEQI